MVLDEELLPEELKEPEPDKKEDKDTAVEALGETETDQEIQKRLKELEEQVSKNYELYLRTYADMENLKKRFQKERENYMKFGNESLLKSLLLVLDNLEAALDHLRKGSDMKAVEEGLELTLKSFYDVLEKAGVAKIDAKGKPFDPNIHEAIMQKEHEGEDQVVLEELQKGYMLYDRLLRPSKVVISKNTEKK